MVRTAGQIAGYAGLLLLNTGFYGAYRLEQALERQESHFNAEVARLESAMRKTPRDITQLMEHIAEQPATPADRIEYAKALEIVLNYARADRTWCSHHERSQHHTSIMEFLQHERGRLGAWYYPLKEENTIRIAITLTLLDLQEHMLRYHTDRP